MSARSVDALRRSAEALLPPFTLTLHLDARLEEVKDLRMLEILMRPYGDSKE